MRRYNTGTLGLMNNRHSLITQPDLGKVEGLLAPRRAYPWDRICKSEIIGIMTAKTESSPPRLANLCSRRALNL